MKSFSFVPIISFVFMVLGQVFLFNQMHIFGSINPILYLLFFTLYRFESNQTVLILLSFLLGFLIDFLSQSGGAHTIATLTLGFSRPLIIRYAFGVTMDPPQSYFSDPRTLNKFIYLLFIIILHHTLYFTLVYFSLDAIFLIAKNTLVTSIFSLILMGIILNFYPNRK